MAKLTAAEVRRHEGTSAFSASKRGEAWMFAWVHTRGRIEKGSGDGGKDLVMMTGAAFPEVVLSGCDSLSGAVFSSSGANFLTQTEDSLLMGDSQSLQVACCLKLQSDESFVGLPVWVREEYILFATSGGQPKRQRLFSLRLPSSKGLLSGLPVVDRRILFVADHGASLLSWDHSQAVDATAARVAVLHRLANAMYAEVVVCAGPEGQLEGPSRVVAVDARVEYCKPCLAFLTGGRLLMRLNLPVDARDGGADFMAKWTASGPQRGSEAKPLPATHGLWVLENVDDSDTNIKPVNAGGTSPTSEWRHGTYDVCSGAYGNGQGLVEGFVLDSTRETAVTAARPWPNPSCPSYADQLWLVEFIDKGDGSFESSCRPLDTCLDKGCYVPVACCAGEVIYHYRSPIERGDLWAIKSSEGHRCTRTMPRSLQQKLLTPVEVMLPAVGHDIHALLFTPDSGDKLQPLLWLHGGPMAQYSWDYNPLLSWLASLGYMVLAPNYAGSTGSGIEFMDKVLADGCGRADVADCLTCAKWLKSNGASNDRLDLSRGVAVGGHSWGGYLAFMCMLQGEIAPGTSKMETVFSCGIATAGITDFKVQQRHTEVRYYDYTLMGGWVYEEVVAERARKASPITHASDLRAPLLILHGESDIDVPFQQIPAFVDAARRSSHPRAEVEYHTYPGEGHGMGGTASQADYLNRVETFLRINLKPWDFTDNPHGELTAY